MPEKFSVKKYSQAMKDRAKKEHRVLFIWEQDKRFIEDPLEQAVTGCCGTMTLDQAKRIWAIINEHV